MVNLSSRSPGPVQKFEANARISEAPSFAVDTGAAWRALAAVGSQLSNRLGQMADRAAAQEGEQAGLNAGQQAGASYLQHQAVTAQATAQAAGLPTDIDGIIQAAAEKHGVSADAMRIVAKLESSGNPNAKNPTSSAGGLFQFIDSTAADYGLANRYDPVQASDAAARLMKDNAAQLRGVLGREPTGAELYLAHQQGAGGASALLRNPGARAADVVGADAVRLNGGRADMTAGEFAGIWIAKAGGTPATPIGGTVKPTSPVEAVTNTYAGEPLSTEPLALRRDGTIRGEAFDAAATRAWGWRFQAGLTRDLGAVYEANKDNPAGYAKAANDVVNQYSQDQTLASDPQAREAFDKLIYEKTEAARLDIAARQETRLRNEEIAATTEGLQTLATDLERQAFTLGANPEADALLAPQLERANASIAAALEDGLITPAQALSQREAIATSVANARIQGTFNALETPAQKEAFALGLMEEWASGEGPIAQFELSQVKSLSNTLFSQARAEQNQQTAEQRAEATRVTGLIADDLTSMAASGQGLDLAAAGVTAEKVGALLGEEKLVSWQAARDLARDTWLATSGMELESSAEIGDRLAALQPEEGQPGFARQAEIYAAAEKRALDLLEERKTDPLGQAHRGKLVELVPIDTSSAEAMQQSLATRRDQARQVAEVYGTPVTIFRASEREALTAALYGQPEFLPDFARTVTSSLGDLAPKALSEISEAGPELAYAAGIANALEDSSVVTEVSRVLVGRRDKTINVKLPSAGIMAEASGSVLGSALQGNPATRSAVVNVATVLFEGQAAAMGFDPADIKDPNSPAFAAWERSVNRALGARQVNGEQFGGLTVVNGVPTVAPPSMRAADLQAIVSSLSAEDLAGLPPIGTGNGVPVQAWQLQGAKLVAVGNGSYRVALGDPGGFDPQYLQTPQGQPWVLDIEDVAASRASRPAPGNFSPFQLPSFWRRPEATQ